MGPEARTGSAPFGGWINGVALFNSQINIIFDF